MCLLLENHTRSNCVNCDSTTTALIVLSRLVKFTMLLSMIISCLLFSRKRLFNMINDLPTVYEVVTGATKKQQKEKSTVSNHRSNKSKPNSKKVKDYVLQVCFICMSALAWSFILCDNFCMCWITLFTFDVNLLSVCKHLNIELMVLVTDLD